MPVISQEKNNYAGDRYHQLLYRASDQRMTVNNEAIRGVDLY